MMNIRKLLIKKWVMIIVGVILVTVSSIYFLQFRSVINCFAIGFSNFNKIEKNVYVETSISSNKSKIILDNISIAKERVTELFGNLSVEPTFIFCEDIDLAKKYGMRNKTGITHRSPIGSFIVLGPDGFNVDVISHEFTHSELFRRIGWTKMNNIPLWFDEGLATQVDNRPQYSESEWARRTQDGKKLIDMRELHSASQFYNSDLDTRVFHYTLSKHELKRWLSIAHQERLLQLIEEVKKGNDFYQVYKRLELENKND